MEAQKQQVKEGTQFPFSKLPQEIRLNIFDEMNMRAPQQKMYWNIPFGFLNKTPDNKNVENKSLFFVNKEFYQKAREMFWSQNHFIIAPDKKYAMGLVDPHEPLVVDPDSPPNRYAGAVFLDQFLHGEISIEVMQHLKSLELEWFHFVDHFDPEQKPREDWFNTLETSHRVAGLYLDFMFIPAVEIPMAPGDDISTWKNMSIEDVVSNVRGFVQEEAWPLSGPSYMPPFTNHLVVVAGTDYIKIMYSHRKRGHETGCRLGTEGIQKMWKKYMRVPHCPPLVSIQHMSQTTEDQARGNFRPEEWIEEIWMIPVEDPYGELEWMTEAGEYR